MAVELATGVVNLIPSFRGGKAAIVSELGPAVSDGAEEVGKTAGDKLQQGMVAGSKDAGKKIVAALGLLVVGAVALKSAKDVEDAQNTIIRSTGATGVAADKLQESFRNVASGTAASFGEVSQTLSELYQRTGLQGKALEGLTSQVVSFNRQFKDSPITVDALTKSLAGFNVPGDQMGKVLDHLFIISQKTGVPLNELLVTMQGAGPLARQFGLSVEETATLLAKLNRAGVDANQILPGLKKVFKDAADAGKDPQEALKGIIGEIGNLVKAGDTIGARNLAVQMFGPKGLGLVDAVTSGKLSLQDFNKSISATGDGIVDTGKKTGTLAGALGILKNNVQLALAGFATPGLEAANSVLRAILPTVQSLGKEFAALPDPAKLALVSIVGIGFGVGKIAEFVTNAGPGLVALGKGAATAFRGSGEAIAGATSLLEAFTLAELAAAAAPFAIVAGIVAIGFALHLAFGGDLAGQLTKDFKQGEAAGKAWAQTLIAGAHATAAPVTTLSTIIRNTRAEYKQWDKDVRAGRIDATFDQAATTAFRFRTVMKGLKTERASLIQQQKEEAAANAATKASLETYTTAVQGGGSATDAFANLTDDAKKAVQSFQDILLAASGGQIGYEQSIENMSKAQDALNLAVFLFGPNSKEAHAAQLDLFSAQNAGVAAANNLEKANADLQTTVKDPTAYQTELTRLQTLVAQGGPLTQVYQDQINKLLELHRVLVEMPALTEAVLRVRTEVIGAALPDIAGMQAFIDQNTGLAALQPLVDFLGSLDQHASGGIFTQPHFSVTAEKGPEAILPLSDPARSMQILNQTGLFTAAAPPAKSGVTIEHVNYYGPLDDPAARTRAIAADVGSSMFLLGV